jgi:hypothetical protein
MWNDLENTEENCDKIEQKWKKKRKNKLNSGKILKIWN